MACDTWLKYCLSIFWACGLSHAIFFVFLKKKKKNEVLAFSFFTTPDILLSFQAKKKLEVYCHGRVRKKPSTYLFWTRNCLFFCLVFSRFLTHGHTQLFELSQQLFKTSLCLMYGGRVIKKDRSGRAKQLQAKLQGVMLGGRRKRQKQDCV